MIFLQWSVTRYINHTPEKAPWAGVVSQHKINFIGIFGVEGWEIFVLFWHSFVLLDFHFDFFLAFF